MKFFKTIISSFKHTKLIIVIFFILSMILNYLVTYIPVIIQYFIDTILHIDTKNIILDKIIELYKPNVEFITLICIILIIVQLAIIFFTYFRDVTKTKIIQEFQNELKMKLFKHIQNLTYQDFYNNSLADLVQNSSDDVNNIVKFIENWLTYILDVILIIIFAIVQLVNIDFRLSSIMLFLSLFIIIASIIYYKKSKDIESEKDKVKVDGKSKNCEKLTLELDGDDVKDLLIEYVDTFKSDKKLQEIINKSIKAYTDSFNEMATVMGESSTSLPEMDNVLDELLDNIDELKDEIKDLDLDIKVVLTVYATNTDVYRTDISIFVENMEIILESTFNKEDTVIDVAMKSSGIKVDVATITIKSEKNSASVKVETAEGIEDYLGEKMYLEIVCKNDDKKTELTISADLGKNGKASIALVSNVDKNEDNEYAAETSLNFDIDIEDVITTKGSLNIKSNIKVGNVSIPSISEAETVDANDQEAVAEYMTEAQTNIVELMDKVSKIEGLSDLLDIPEALELPTTPVE